ncbi:MAG: hypothetical protein U0031_05420 [Thermomicrobiales bacterium]
MTANQTTRRTFGTRIIMGALVLSLFAVAGAPAGVGAERPPSNGDSHQQACRALYDRAEQLRNEYKSVAAQNPGSASLDSILAELRNIGQTWKDIKCDSRYGSISALITPQSTALHSGVADNILVNVSDAAAATEPGVDNQPTVDTGNDDTRPTATVHGHGKHGKKGKTGRR